MIAIRTGAVALSLLLLAGAPAWAQDGTQLGPDPAESTTRVGTRGANFLEIGIGARALGMGGAIGALVDDASALYWNPSGIAQNPGFRAILSYNDMYGDFGIEHFFGGLTLPLGVGAVGVSLISLSSGEIERTDEAFPEGGNPLFGATFEWSALSVGLTYARPITDRLVVGATLKLVQEGIEDAEATFFGGDLGVQFETGLYGVTIGASLLHVGSSGRLQGPVVRTFLVDADDKLPTEQTVPIELDTDEWDMPTAFRFSVLWDLVGSPEAVIRPDPRHNVLLVSDIVDGIDTNVMVNIGFEYSYNSLVFVRGGKHWANEREADFRDFAHGLAFGLGFHLPIGDARRLKFDYAYTDQDLLDNVQTFTFEYGL